MVNAILFDLDGTLLNTLEDLTNAMNFAKCKFGYKENTISDTRSFIGNGIHNYILKSINYDETHLEEIEKRFKEYYSKNCDVYTKPYDGIFEILDYLKDKDIILGVISNKAIYATETLINNHFPNYFDIIIGDGMGIAKKPQIDSLQYVSNKYNISLSNILYIGDSDVDIKTISNAKCQGIIVSYGFRDKEELLKLTDNVYDSTEDVLLKLKELL